MKRCVLVPASLLAFTAFLAQAAPSLSEALTGELAKSQAGRPTPQRQLLKRELPIGELPGQDAPRRMDPRPLKDLSAAAPRFAGFFVRFSDPGVQALAVRNLPPPSQLVASIHKAVQHRVWFERAIAGRMHLFRFADPLNIEQATRFIDVVRALQGIDLVEINVPVEHHQSASIDSFASYQWNMLGSAERIPGGIAANRIWPITYGTSYPIVAVVDTGVLPHPDFSSRLLPGYDFVSSAVRSNDGSGIDGDATDPGDWAAAGECGVGQTASNSSWHGTHVAGIVGADGLNGIGIAGVSWRVRLLPVRVIGKCGGTVADIINGIHWAAGLPVPGAPANLTPAHVINLSLSGLSLSGCDRGTQEAVNQALGQGALVVVAAGNASDDAALYTPASCNGVLSVVATDHLGQRASYSNISFTAAGISAPGGDMARYGEGAGIVSTVGSGTKAATGYAYLENQGTSMSAPHVSGVAALALSVNQNLSGAELAFLMQYSATSFPAGSVCASFRVCGSGIVNAYNTVYYADLIKTRTLVYEFYNSGANHFFRTGSRVEASAVNRGSAGPGWYDTVNYFYGWSTNIAGTQPVCRFYSTGANSHFYTANAAECAAVKGNRDWTYEGVAFYAKVPSGGQCASSDTPVYRAYNNRHGLNDQNHRFTTDIATYQLMISRGWLGEGVVLCV